LIGLTQLGLSKHIEAPPCNGIPVYALLENFRRGINGEDPPEHRTEKAESLPRYLARVGGGLVLWLPDHLKEIKSGDMTLRNYSIGGFRCFNYPFTSSSESLPPVGVGDTPTEESEITKHDIWGEQGGSQEPKRK
jgi:hypothetical protein